ncbi:hypothetical protein [Aestuariivirga sp.]|uniref:hypothetical protein n=1 Tax=Aestuariivirga sp. TaxID=2650926 RepID=UPI003593349E
MELINENMTVIIAAVAVLVLLLIVLSIWRAVSPRMSGRRGQRLGISEYHELDKSRRLVLVRRDNVEHLILIGGPLDVVVETGITAASIASAYGASTESGSVRPAPRPAVFGDRKAVPPLRPVEPTIPPVRGRDDPEI